MPIYKFRHPKTNETIEIIQRMKETHVYVDDEGVEWSRVWESPNASVDTSIDPFSAKQFREKTGKKGETLGEMWDLSAELSKKRKEKHGYDPVKQKALEKYKDKRNVRSDT